jgi:hypothetical protein
VRPTARPVVKAVRWWLSRRDPFETTVAGLRLAGAMSGHGEAVLQWMARLPDRWSTAVVSSFSLLPRRASLPCGKGAYGQNSRRLGRPRYRRV